MNKTFFAFKQKFNECLRIDCVTPCNNNKCPNNARQFEVMSYRAIFYNDTFPFSDILNV